MSWMGTMPEDTVVRPIFGSRKVEVGEDIANLHTPLVPLKIPDFEKDFMYCLSNLELVWQANLRGDEMTNYLFDVVGYKKTDSSLELRRPVVRDYSFEQFCDSLLRSSRKEWPAQPAFFGALFLEFDDRQRLILASIDERKEQAKVLAGGHMKILLKLALRMQS